MKRLLMAGTVLTVLGGVTAAQASTPIKLELGGESMWLFGAATQKSAFKEGKDYSSTDVKGSNKLYVLGETLLDNGMKVGVEVHFLAGGSSNINDNDDPVDQSWVYVESRYGKLLIGSIDNPAYLLHVSAPDASGLSEDADLSVVSGRWVVNPDDLYYVETTAIDVTGSAEKIMFFTPKMAGFTFGAGFTPGSSNDGDYTQGNRDLGVANETYTLGMHYGNEFDNGLSLDVSLGWQTGKGLHAHDSFGNYNGADIDTYNDYSAGLQISHSGFTFGGAGRFQKTKDDLGDKVELFAWTVGAQYDFDEKVIPLAVSLNYFNSTAKFKQDNNDKDKVHNVNLAVKYMLGEGVDWIGTVSYVKYSSDRNDIEKNRGWAAITGLSLAF